MNIDLRLGDCLEVLKTIPDNSIDSVVTDPPYGLGFMNKEWDSPEKLRQLTQREAERSAERKAEGKSPTDAPFSKSVPPGLAIKGAKEGKWFQDWCELWAAECLRILKPGGHILSFSAPRTYHRMATAFEDAGFEIRDQLMWVFGSGFPKSHNIGKAIDKIEGNERKVVGQVERKDFTNYDGSMMNVDNRGKHVSIDVPITKGNTEWEGWGTALKPAHEPIVMARKPLSEKSIAENVLKHGTGGINIDGSRIGTEDKNYYNTNTEKSNFDGNTYGFKDYEQMYKRGGGHTEGRFPANIIFDEEAGQLLDEQSGISKSRSGKRPPNEKIYGGNSLLESKTTSGETIRGIDDQGGASRFFYCPKASKKDRNEGINNLIIWEDKLTTEQQTLNELLKDISVDMINIQDEQEWNIISFGNNITEQYPKDIKFIISIILKMIIGLKTSNYYPHLNIKDYIVDVIKMIMENGLNLVDYVENINQLKQNTTNELWEYRLGVVSVVLPTLLSISKKGKTGNFHATVKPTDLMRYLINLITPPNGTVLDPFMGSGSTGKAAVRCGVNFVGIEKEEEYMEIAKARIEHERNKPVQQKLYL
jgi:DNA modification methylase